MYKRRQEFIPHLENILDDYELSASTRRELEVLLDNLEFRNGRRSPLEQQADISLILKILEQSYLPAPDMQLVDDLYTVLSLVEESQSGYDGNNIVGDDGELLDTYQDNQSNLI